MEKIYTIIIWEWRVAELEEYLSKRGWILLESFENRKVLIELLEGFGGGRWWEGDWYIDIIIVGGSVTSWNYDNCGKIEPRVREVIVL